MPESMLIRGGTLVDGTGRPSLRADVLIEGERVVAIQAAFPDPPAAEVLDATGCIVAPGFVDLHSHSDFTLLVNRSAASSLKQGVTTEVVGNCGLSFAPAYRPDDTAQSLPTLLRDLPVTWRTFSDYLQLLEQGGLGINVAHLVGLNAVRLSTCGYAARPLAPDELGQARALLAQSLDAGAWGFSAGLEYAPGRSATTDELVELCQEVAARDSLFAVHMRNQDEMYLEAVEEALTVGARSGARLQISHLPPHRYSAPPGSAERALDRIGSARHTGQDVAFDVHPYLWGMTFLTAVLPPWAFEGGTEGLRRRLADRAQRDALRAYDHPLPAQIREGLWHTVIPRNLEVGAGYNGLTMAEIARLRDQEPMEALFDLLLDEGDRVQALLWIFEIVDERDLQLLLRTEYCAVESDGMALAESGPTAREALHPRCFGWTARFLGEHVRDRGVLALPEAIRRMTQLPAHRLGLTHRGTLEAGSFADIVVFDPRELRDRATYETPNCSPVGVRWVLVNGEVAAHDGEISSRLSGRILRK